MVTSMVTTIKTFIAAIVKRTTHSYHTYPYCGVLRLHASLTTVLLRISIESTDRQHDN